MSTNPENAFLGQLKLPQRNRWTHRAIAEYLQASRNTVKLYALEIAIVVRDYLAECPRDSKGGIKSGFALSQYQFWVVVKLISFSRLMREDLNGSAYRMEIKRCVARNQQYLSRAAWRYELDQIDNAA